MNENLTEAERFLIDEIRRGSATGWQQLVERYQGRLAAFARRKLGAAADVDDLVQETFISFLKGLPQFREEAALETYLFLILRRKIANWVRSRRSTICQLQEAYGSSIDDSGTPVELPAPDPTASWYARREEANDLQRDALGEALGQVVRELTADRNFRDLQIVEMLFYCQLRNKEVAQVAGVRDNYVALAKHRLLARLSEVVHERLSAASAAPARDFEPPDALITQIWQEGRLSCPKRSTLGASLLGTLDEPWQDYVQFHLERLGCQFCRANLEDMQSAIQAGPSQALRDRIMQSTIGFLGDTSQRP